MKYKLEYILEIPFFSKKKYLLGKRCKYAFSGTCYFMLNKEGKVLRDFAILDEEALQEYRPNDNDMMIGNKGSGTKFWNKKGVKENRLRIFDKSFENGAVKIMSNKMIKMVNDFSIQHLSTSLSLEGFITGSNTSGADTRIESSPFIINSSDFYGLRFINPLKNMRVISNNKNAENNYPIDRVVLEKFQKISLEDYLNKFREAKRQFYKFNPESYNLLFSDKDHITEKIYLDQLNKIELDKEKKSINKSAYKVIEYYSEGSISKSKLIQRLRGYQRASLIIDFKTKQTPMIEGLIDKVQNLDAAHIWSVKDIKKTSDSNLYAIADVDNGMLLPKDLHWKMDNDNDLMLTENFEFLYKGKVLAKLNSKYSNERRKMYLEKRNKNMNF